MRLKVPSLEGCAGQGDTTSLWQAVQEEFCLQVRVGTSTASAWSEEPTPGVSVRSASSSLHRPLCLRALEKAFKTSVAHRLLAQLTSNPKNERQVSVTGKFYLSMNSPE